MFQYTKERLYTWIGTVHSTYVECISLLGKQDKFCIFINEFVIFRKKQHFFLKNSPIWVKTKSKIDVKLIMPRER